MYTTAQQKAIAAIYNKYKHVHGDYSSTMLEGIVSAFCDSGILTDALSVQDALLINKHCTKKQILTADLFYLNDLVIKKTNKQLMCCTVVDELAAINDDVENVAMQLYSTHLKTW